ncbi:MAG: winged helix-turn-helix transcriptional regulator [Fulvimarina manganoxydans]|uniref:MarR family winged helix-turn-helix transcriptional regulator n=1 Tax=Fulvimarina manganoxydans TaxID=937218 RepID=UPI002357441D|nr:MarR family winged helix-turn-helix transcriptional regulator [Fulvimarina manganoxydans]MCK5934440.1 winged helix-turn-helix transcriptional regulator [Fulvimarina manganoxydans]
MTATSKTGETTVLTNRITRIATRFSRVTAQIFRDDYGLTMPEFCVLSILGSGDDHIFTTSSAIVDSTAMDKTKVSRAVSSLDQRGWVSRSRGTDDRRFEHLTLTEAGRKAFQNLMPKVREAELSLLSSIDKSDLAAINAALLALERACGYDAATPDAAISSRR